MKLAVPAVVLALTLSITSSTNAQSAPTSEPTPPSVPGVTVTTDEHQTVQFNTMEVTLEGDVLNVTVFHSCEGTQDTFELFWDGAFNGLLPVEVSLDLVHHDHFEVCEEAYWTTDLQFDLNDIKGAYIEGYGGSGTIIIHLCGQNVEYTF